MILPPSIEVARAYADSFLPRDSKDRLYDAIALCAPFGRLQGPRAPVNLTVFDTMGINIGLYMRATRGAIVAFGGATLISLLPITINVVSGRITGWIDETPELKGASWWSTLVIGITTRGSASVEMLESGWAHALSDCVLTLWLLFCFLYGCNCIERESERLDPRRSDQLCVSQYTLRVQGLPRDVSPQLLSKEVRRFFERWGEVVAVGLPRLSRELLLRARVRQQASERLKESRLRLTRCRLLQRARGSSAAEVDSLEACVRRQGEQLTALTKELAEIRRNVKGGAGIGFVTFNEQRAAHECLRHLCSSSGTIISSFSSSFGSGPMPSSISIPGGQSLRLRLDMAPAPANIIWENLEIGRRELWLRALFCNLVLFSLCICSTAAIVEVTRYAVTHALRGEGSFSIMLWTTLVIIGSNVTIFKMVDFLAKNVEGYHSADDREVAMMWKMLFFQLLNCFIACFSFLWTLPNASSGGAFDLSWYVSGAVTAINIIIGDIFVINVLVEGVRLTDQLPMRFLARFSRTQRMTQRTLNGLLAFCNPLFLPFRVQLGLKCVVFSLVFSSTMPLLHALNFLFFGLGWFTDCSNLLRCSHGVLVTSEKIVLAALRTLPFALVVHHLMAALLHHHLLLEARGWLAQAETPSGLSLALRPLGLLSELPSTISNPGVFLPLGLSVLTLVAALGFAIRSHWRRRNRSRDFSELMRRLPLLDTEVHTQAAEQLRSLRVAAGLVDGIGPSAGSSHRRRVKRAIMKRFTLAMSPPTEKAGQGSVRTPRPHKVGVGENAGVSAEASWLRKVGRGVMTIRAFKSASPRSPGSPPSPLTKTAKTPEPRFQKSTLSHREGELDEEERTKSKSRPAERSLSRSGVGSAHRTLSGCASTRTRSGAGSAKRTLSGMVSSTRTGGRAHGEQLKDKEELKNVELLKESSQPKLHGPGYQPEALLALLKRGSTGVLIPFRDLHKHGASSRLYIAPISGPPVLSASKSTFSAASMAARKLSESDQMEEKARAMSFLFKGTVQWV